MVSEIDQNTDELMKQLGRPFYMKMLLLRSFVQREGYACVPVAHVENGVYLGRWVAAQRSRYRLGQITDKQIQVLESMPHWTWKASDFQWDLGIERLGEFYEREGHIRVPVNHIENRFDLGAWLFRQRKRFRLNRLSTEQVKQLEGFPFDEKKWRSKRVRRTWDERYRLLKQYTDREGTSVVPRRHMEDEFALGVWVNSLRSQYSKGELKAEHIALLEALNNWRWAKPRNH